MWGLWGTWRADNLVSVEAHQQLETARKATASIERSRSFRFRNWAQTYHAHPTLLWRPRTIEEVQAIVHYARATGHRVRAIGAGHSPSDLCCTEGYMISLEKMNDVKEIDEKAMTATFGAGRWLYECHPFLREHGLRFPVLGSISQQSLAGTISTASHGYGWNSRCFSSLVKRMVLVVGDGSVKECSPTKNVDLFNATLCGLGATGIIVEVTVQCCRDSLLEQETFGMDIDEYIDAIVGEDGKPESGIFNTAPHVRAYWIPQAGKILLQRAWPTTKPVDQPGYLYSLFWHTLIGGYFHQLALFFARYVPSYLMLHAKIMWRIHESPGALPRGVRSELIDEKRPWRRITKVASEVNLPELIFNYDCGPRQYTFECAVPIERAPEAVKALKQWLEREYENPNGIRHHFPLEMRPSCGDNVWLSPANGRRVLWIGIMQYKPFDFVVPYKRLFHTFERITIDHGGRAHWAKAHETSSQELDKLYPALPKWRKVRDEVDPDLVFLNSYVYRHIYGRIGEAYDLKRWKKTLPYWTTHSV